MYVTKARDRWIWNSLIITAIIVRKILEIQQVFLWIILLRLTKT